MSNAEQERLDHLDDLEREAKAAPRGMTRQEMLGFQMLLDKLDAMATRDRAERWARRFVIAKKALLIGGIAVVAVGLGLLLLNLFP